MFNEILTGKATLEPTAPVPPPVQEPQPAITLACVDCAREYTAKAGSTAARCPACYARIVQQNQMESAAALGEAQANYRKADAGHRMLKGLIIAAVAIMLAFFRYQMRSQMREDNARAAGYSSYGEYQSESTRVHPTDDYSYKVRGFADQMCGCPDIQCTRTVRAQWQRYVTTNTSLDDSGIESAERDEKRLLDCQDKIESQPVQRTTDLHTN